jgi:WD40 repeat protein
MAPKTNDRNFNPFPGLRPFTPEESDHFFGREKESSQLLEKLIQNRFVTVIGASGSGKSSLVHGGVLPMVREVKTAGSSEWRILSFRPGDNPFGNLADSLASDLEARGMKKIEKLKILSELHNNPEGISGAAKNLKINPEDRILLIVDQFEELFRHNTQGRTNNAIPATSRFIDFIVKAVSESSVNIFTVLIMRSDYIGECAHYPGLTELLNNSNYLVPLMGPENYRQVIEGPVRYAGNKIDQVLVDRLLDEIGGRTDQLPVLQHTLMRTYAHWLKIGDAKRPVGTEDYESVGTMRNAMSLHANEAYEELDQRGKDICSVLFRTITGKGSDNKGFRRPESVATIKAIAGCEEKELFNVIEKFRLPGRSFIIPGKNVALNEETIIDISHESLINLWNRLRGWVDEEAASVQMYKRLSEASAMYQQGKTGLLRQPDLQLALNWRESGRPSLSWAERYNPAFERAMMYLRTSEKAWIEEEDNKLKLQRRKMKRSKVIASLFGVAVIISLAFMLFAFIRKTEAVRVAAMAEQQKNEAELQRMRADSIAHVVNADLQTALTDMTAIRKEAEEEQRKSEIANQQKYLALRDKDIAVRNVKIAEAAKENVSRLRMVSTGKTMAIRSLQMSDQQELQSLLAYQAYLFNKKNNGFENDADIFSGLYNVARRYGGMNYKSYKGHEGGIRSIAFAPGKREFFTSGTDGKVIRWSLDGKNQTLQVVYSGSDIIDVLAVSPDDSWLACGSENSVIRMIPLKSNTRAYELNGHSGSINSLVFSYDGKYLYSAAVDGKVLKWDLAVKTSTDVNDGTVKITSIDLSRNGHHIAGISSDGGVLVWNPEDKADRFSISTVGKNVKAIRFDPENNLLAIGDDEGTVELWNIEQHKKISEIKAHDGQINDIRFNTSLKQMATAGNDKKIKIYNIKDPGDLTELPVTFSDNEGVVLVMQFSPDGQFIVSGEIGGTPNLLSRPVTADYLANSVCSGIERNMTEEEWKTYVGKDISYEKTCSERMFRIKVDVIKN